MVNNYMQPRLVALQHRLVQLVVAGFRGTASGCDDIAIMRGFVLLLLGTWGLPRALAARRAQEHAYTAV